MAEEYKETPLNQLLAYEFQRVDQDHLQSAILFDVAAADGNFKRLRKIKDDELRSLVLRYGSQATEFKWARAMIREEAERRDRRSWRERLLLALISILFGSAGGALVKWLWG